MIPAIVAFVSSIGPAVGAAVSTIGSALSTFASTIGPMIGEIVTRLPAIAEVLSKVANAVLTFFAIFKPGEKVEELGERALQAAEQGTTLDQFDDFDAYLETLRSFELDPGKAEKRSMAEKLVAGLAVGTVGMESKLNTPPGSLDALWLLAIANPTYFTAERMQSLISSGPLTGDILGYLNKSLDAGDSRRMEESLASGEGGGALDNAGKEKLYEALDSARDQWESLGRQLDTGRGA